MNKCVCVRCGNVRNCRQTGCEVNGAQEVAELEHMKFVLPVCTREIGVM